MRYFGASCEAADVVFHKAYMMHTAAGKGDEQGRIRLAGDLGFYEEGAVLDQRWINIFQHDNGLG